MERRVEDMSGALETFRIAKPGRAARRAGLLCLMMFFGAGFSERASAADCLSNLSGGSGNWNDPATWTGCNGSYPQSGDTVTIRTADTVAVNGTFTAAGMTVTAPTGNGTSVLDVGSGSLMINGNVAITGGTGQKKAQINIGTGTLTVNGNVAESGVTIFSFSGAGTLNITGDFPNGFNDYTAGTGTTVFNGSGTQNVGTYNYYNLTVNKSGTATTVGNITVGNNLNIAGGTLNIGGNSINRGTTGGIFTLASGATLQITTASFPGNYSTCNLDANGTTDYTGTSNLTVSAPPAACSGYGNLLLSGSGNRNLNAMTVRGTLGSTGTVAAFAQGNLTIRRNIDFGVNATFAPNTYAVTMDGTSAQTIGGGVASIQFHHLVINNSAGVTATVNHSVKGDLANTVGFNAGTTTTTFNGTAIQNIVGATTFYDLTVDNSAGVTIANDVTVGNALTFGSGRITTGANALIIGSTTTCGGVTGAGAGKYVYGRLRKNFTASLRACDFEIGDATNYTPVNVSFSSVTGGGTVTAKATNGDHPQIGMSGLDSANSINRYWMLTPGGGLAFGGVTLTFTPIGGSPVDHDNTANVGSYITQRYEISGGACDPADAGYTGAGSWNNTTATGTQTTTRIAATGIGTFGNVCSHFAHGRSAVAGFSREPQWIYQRELYY